MSEQKEKTPTAKQVSIQTISEDTQLVNDYDIDAFLEKRKEFITKVNAIMVEGKDYHVIQGKKSLAKGGAEKIASIFGWSAEFEKDQDVAGAFTDIKGLIAFVCNLTKAGQRLGQGRGASTLAKNANDPNKTIKMAQKSAFIDAVLRASGLSDFFTQDLEDMPSKVVTPLKSPNLVANKEPDINQIVPGNPPVNLVGQNYERYAKMIQNAKIIKELEGYGQNIKFLGKTLSNEEKTKLRAVFKKKMAELEPIQIEKGDLPQ